MDKPTIKTLTHSKEFYLTGAYAKGVEIDGKTYLIVTQIEEDTFCSGDRVNSRVEREYGL